MNVNIAITGASGSIYARLLAERLVKERSVKHIRIIFTTNGKDVAKFEQCNEWLENLIVENSEKVEIVSNNNFYCSLASGSGGDSALVIIPCSVGMLSRVANGISDDLISRGADVMLKERKKLIIVVRESPLNIIHLNNMVTLTSAGAIIIPASPSFYSKPQTIDELCNTTIDIVIRQLGIDVDCFKWNKSSSSYK